MRKLTTGVLVLLAGLSCSKDSGTGPKPNPTPIVTVTPESATVDLFDTLHLQAAVRDSQGNSLNETVTWSSASPDTVFVSNTGKVEGLARGTITISASAGRAAGHARIKVKINVTSIHLTPPSGTLLVGDTVRLTPTLSTGNGQAPDDSLASWRSSDTSLAVVSATGLVTARAKGSPTIFAQVDSAVGTATFTVPEPVTKIILSAHVDTLRQDSLFHITATPIGTSNDTLLANPVTWTSSDTSIAKLSENSFDADIGAYEPGRAVIRAQIGKAFDSCVVIVVRPSVATIAVSPDTGRKILPAGFSLHAVVKDSTGVVLTQRVITWTLSDTAIADIAPVTGTDVSVFGKNPGTVRALASSEGKTDSATLEFVHPSVASVTITPDTGSFLIPDQQPFDLNATVRDSAGDTLTDRVTTWTVGDTTIAAPSPVTGSGTNVFGKKAGIAVVVATTEGRVDTARILVIRPTVRKVVISPDTTTLVAPGSDQISATPEDSLNQPLSGRLVQWAALDTAVASLSATSGNPVEVIGRATGTARFVATVEGVSDTAVWQVFLPPVAHLVLVGSGGTPPPDSSPILLNAVRLVGALPEDSLGNPMNRTVTFSSSDSAIASLQPYLAIGDVAYEYVGGQAPGSAIITATTSGKTVTWHASVYSVTYDTIAAGNSESCMPASNGAVYCWGQGPYPTPVVGTSGIHRVSAKLSFACGLDGSGNAYCWGQSPGPLGTGGGTATYDTARAVIGGTQFSQLDVGWDHTCGVTIGGGLACWGNNDQAQLGLGDSTARNQPTALPVSATFASVSAGYLHTCAVSNAGKMYCWGANGSGQAGEPAGTDVGVPTAVDTALTFSLVSSGFDHSCGLTTTGAAYCWGGNTFGQLGTGDTTSHATPVPVVGGLTFKSIAAAEYATCGVTTAGAAYCWGNDVYLALGTSVQSSSLVPLSVSGGLTFTSISAGIAAYGTVCGMTTTGAYCWGIGAAGGPTKTPVKIPGQP